MQRFNSAHRVAFAIACGIAITSAQAQSPPLPQGKTLAASAGVIVYPAKGQAAAQQTKDEAECYNWAKTQSGYDPMAPPPPPAPAQAPPPSGPAADGSRARGALRGAAAGAVIGEIGSGDAGEGAAYGAAVGAIAGGRRSRMAQSQQQAQAQAQAEQSAAQAQAAQQELANTFKRGMGVCLEARGYTIT